MGKLKKLAADHGEPVEILIPRLMAEHGTPFKVAVHLGLYPNTIYYWLKTHGFTVVDGVWFDADGQPITTSNLAE